MSVDLIDKVKHGFRPYVPESAPSGKASVIQKCWEHKDTLRPSALQVSRIIVEYLENNHDNMLAPDNISDTNCLNKRDVNTPNISVATVVNSGYVSLENDTHASMKTNVHTSMETYVHASTETDVHAQWKLIFMHPCKLICIHRQKLMLMH